MKAYCISGLGADHRVFHFLQIKYEIIHLDWIRPLKSESLEKYSNRLSGKINQEEAFVIIGVSFGGIIAVEISKKLPPQKTILISSIQTSDELPNLYSIAGKFNLIQLLPLTYFKPPIFLMRQLFGTKHPLLEDILRDANPSFVKWAIQALLSWKNTGTVSSIIAIGGSKNLILASQKSDYLIEGGHHFMIVDRAEEISTIINSL